MFAKLSGAPVAVLDIDPERAGAAEAIAGVKSIVLTGDVQQSVAAFAGDTGFDVVFDATGNRASMEKGFDFVNHGGRYVLVSVIKDPITFSDPDFHRKEMTLLGSRNATSADFDTVISAIRERKVPIDKLITHRTSLAAAAEKLPVWAKQKSGLIKALIEID